MAARPISLLLVAFACLTLAPRLALAQQPPTGWTLTVLTPDSGTQGARRPSLSADGQRLAFTSDADLAPGAPGNSDGNAEVFLWDATTGFRQITNTSRAGGGFPSQSKATISANGQRIAFLSNADLGGGNADRSIEVFLWDATTGFTQLTDNPSGSAAEGADLSADGATVAFWQAGVVTGENPDGGLELFLRSVGGPLRQLTQLTGRPYHSEPAISADGQAVAFVLAADITGGNGDAGWELFRWQGPATTPGDPARFTQLTDNHAPMVGHELYTPTISGDGRQVAFAGKGHVTVSEPASHTNSEIYLWEEATAISRLTNDPGRQPSYAPRFSQDGSHIAFVTNAKWAGLNPDETPELFVWTPERCGMPNLRPVTASTNRPNVSSLTADIVPAINADGTVTGFIAERADNPNPLVLTRRGLLVRAVEDVPSPCAGAATPTATPDTQPSPSPVPTPSTGPRVCPQVIGRVPPAVLADALAQPDRVQGWGQPANPGRPPGPDNPLRTWLTLLDLGKPYGPANGVLWRAGCP
jgi:Tol biopolymer transport system component